MVRGVYVATARVRRRVLGRDIAVHGVTVSLAGVDANGAAATVSDLSHATADLIGISVDGNVGWVVGLPEATVILISVESQSGVADLGVTATGSILLSGVSASALAGAPTVQTGPSVIIDSVSGVAGVGVMLARGNARVTVTRATGTGAVGTAQAFESVPVSGERVGFAAIPEIIFVRGYSETIELGPFLIDPLNRWTPGDMTNAAGWVSRFDVALNGSLAAQLSWNATTMRLTYTSSGTDSGTISASVTLSAQGQTSRTFLITVLQPTVTWGAGGTIDPTTVTGNISNNNSRSWNKVLQTYKVVDGTMCLLVLAGTYLNKTGTVTTFLESGGAGLSGRVYIVGQPGARPVLEYSGVNMRLACRNCTQFYFKNFEVDGRIGTTAAGIKWTPTSVHQAVAWGIDVEQNAQEPFSINTLISYGGQDAYTYRAAEAFVHECRGGNQGIASLSHMHYHHYGSFAAPNDMNPTYTFGNRATLYLNASWFGASPYGHTLKVECASEICNTHVQCADDWDDPALTYDRLNANSPVNLHVNMRTIFYNNRIEHAYSRSPSNGQPDVVYIGSRNTAEGGGTLPPYFRDTSISSNPDTYTLLNARVAGLIFHGSETALGTLYAGTVPSDVPWWNLVGYRPTDDRLNVNAYSTFLAYNSIAEIDVSDRVPSQSFRSVAHRQDASGQHENVSATGGAGIGGLHRYLNVPRNWRNQSRAACINNRYEGFDLDPQAALHNALDAYGAQSDTLTVFPEGAWPTHGSAITVLSDEAANEQDVPLPDWWPLSFDSLPTSDLTTTADALASGAGSFFITPLTNDLVVAGQTTPTDTELYLKASSITSGFSATLDVVDTLTGIHDLATETARLNPEDTLAYWDISSTKRCQHWGSRGCWDPVTRRVLVMNSPANESDNLLAQLLTVYDETRNAVRVYEDPIGRSIGHMYDANALDVAGRRFYRWTLPITGSQPQLCVINVDAISLDTPASAQQQGAFVREIARLDDQLNTSGAAMDFFPGVGVCLYSRDRVWVLDPATDAWSGPYVTGVTGTIHNLAHYNPDIDRLVFGGGSNSGTGDTSLAWFTMDASHTITRLDDSVIDSTPVVMSTNSDNQAHKVCATFMPGRNRSVFFHQDGNIYVLNTAAASGSQWSIAGAMDANTGVDDRWCVAIPDRFCVLLVHYGTNGTGTLKCWKLP